MPDGNAPQATIQSTDLPTEGGSAAFQVYGMSILVCRSEGRLYVVENLCSHRNQPLLGGRVRRGHILCPHHGARFALADGRASGLPASGGLRVLACREDHDGLVIDPPSNGPDQKPYSNEVR